jgi:hypothetical protein
MAKQKREGEGITLRLDGDMSTELDALVEEVAATPAFEGVHVTRTLVLRKAVAIGMKAMRTNAGKEKLVARVSDRRG